MLKYLFGFMYRAYIEKDLDIFADGVTQNVSNIRKELGRANVRVVRQGELLDQYRALVERQGKVLEKCTRSLDYLTSRLHTLESRIK